MRRDIPPDLPLRAELFSAERMERHGPILAASHHLLAARARDRLLARLSDNQQALLDAAAQLKSALDANQRLAPAAEWLLDNFYLVEEQVRTAKRH
ncbi:MAG TPA: hypothetical protein VFP44_22640, partial [Usitatibacter sp.]|nr:hypothetical protein [Usitatibacter sp.]